MTGTPTARQAPKSYLYRATDADGDEARLDFALRVKTGSVPTFGSQKIVDKIFRHNIPVVTEALPEATGGDGPLAYSISPALPFGLRFNPATREISGTSAEWFGAEFAHTYTYIATDADGDRASLPFLLDIFTEYPRKPENLKAVPGLGSVALTWTPSPDGSIVRYYVSYQQGSNVDDPIEWKDPHTNGRSWKRTHHSPIPGSHQSTGSYTVTGLFGGEQYAFQIIAEAIVNGVSYGRGSHVVTATPLASTPGAVSGLAAAGDDGSVALTWTLPPAPPSTDKLHLRWKPTADLPFSPYDTWTVLSGTATAHRVTGLTNATPYTFEMRASNGNGEGPLATVAATPEARAPAQPANLTATASAGAVTLAWDDPSDATLTGYELRYTDAASFADDDAWTAIADSTAATTSHEVTGLAGGTTYRFELRAVNATGPGPASAEATVLTIDRTPSFGDETVADRSFTLDEAITAFTLPEATGGDGALSYALTPDLPAGLALDAATRTVSGTPTMGQAVATWSWTATDADGDAASLGFTLKVLAVPGAPTGLAAAGDDGSVVLTWALPTNTNDIASQQLRWKATSTLPFTASDAWTDLAGDATRHRVTGLANDTGYSFELRAANEAGAGPAATVAGTPAVAPPSRPSGLTATVGIGEVTLSWDDPQDPTITGYELRHSRGAPGGAQAASASTSGNAGPDNTWTAIPGSGPETTSHTVTGLPERTTWRFQVRAVNASGNAPASGEVLAVVEDLAPSFGTTTIRDYRIYSRLDFEITLPEAQGGDGALTYALTPALPPGRFFDPATRRIYRAFQPATPAPDSDTVYTYSATDADGDRAALTFNIAVRSRYPVKFDADSLTAKAGDGRVTLSWDNPNDSAIGGYIVRHRQGGSEWFADPFEQHARMNVYYPPFVWPEEYSGGWRLVRGSNTNTTGHTVTGLTNGATYTFAVRALLRKALGKEYGEDRIGPDHWTKSSKLVTVTPNAIPVAPGDFAASADDGALALSWTRPGNTIDIEKLQLRWKATSALPFTDSDAWTDLAGDATAHRVTGLTNGVNYSFELRAANGLGTGAAATAQGAPKAMTPAKPTGLAATAVSGAALLAWDDPSDPTITGYELRYTANASFGATDAWSAIAGSGGATTEYKVTGLTDDTLWRFQIRAVNASGAGPASDEATATPQDLAPSFGTASISDKLLRQNSPVTGLIFPAATGGNPPLTYSVTPALPDGLVFGRHTRQIAGTPSSAQTATAYSLKVADMDGDEAVLPFVLTVSANSSPSFGGATVANRSFTQNVAIAPVTLPEATGGEGTLTYSMTPLPPGLSFDAATRQISGTPTVLQTPQAYLYTATDEDIYDDWLENGKEKTSLSFTIAVVTGGAPDFGSATVADMAFDRDRAITPLTLPEATGGDGALAYSIEPALPAGLTFDAATRQVSGAAIARQAPKSYLYRATDADGDEARLGFALRVKTGSVPTFGSQKIVDKIYRSNIPAVIEALPEASGGDGPLAYSISPGLPHGLRFDPATRELSGTPRTWFGEEFARTYTYMATDADGDRASLPFLLNIFFDAPRKPENLRAVVGLGSVALTWTPSPDGSIVRYYVSYQQGSNVDDPWEWKEPDSNGRSWKRVYHRPIPGSHQSTGSYTVTGLFGGEQYAFQIIAEAIVNGVSYGRGSHVVTATPLALTPGAVSGLAAAGDDGSVALTWTLPPAPPSTDKLHLRWKPTADLPFSPYDTWTVLSGTATAHRVTGLTNATPYTFEMRASNGNGEGPLATVVATPEARAPAQPANLTATASAGAVTLAWDDPSDATLTGYELRYTDAASFADDDAWTAIADSSATTTSHEVTGLAGGTTYRFELRAVNATGPGPASAEATALIPDLAPSFGAATVADLTVTQGVAMTALTLPEATGGDGTLSYALTPDLPDGLALDAATRTVSGTPAAGQAATSYSWTATDEDGDTASLSFAIGVLAIPGAPTGLAAIGGNGGLALAWTLPTDTAGIDKMQLRWKESAALPFTDADAWTDLPGAATGYRVRGLTNDTAYSVELRAANALGAGPVATVSGAPRDLAPSFGQATVADVIFTQGVAITAFALPEATGGDGLRSYALTPDLPAGLALDMATRTVSGTPTASQAATSYSWTVTDSDGDSASLGFAMTVEADTAPSFGSVTLADRTFTTGEALTALTLPEATGGNGALAYALTPDLPDGLAFDAATRTVSGTPTAVAAATSYSWTATDAEGDTASLSFTIRVVAPGDLPSFGFQIIPDLNWFVGHPVQHSMTLPAATGGTGALTYSLTPDLPAGLTFDGATRELAGVPWNGPHRTTYTYTAEDEDGDRASLTFVMWNGVWTGSTYEPGNLAAEAGNGQVTLTWNSPSYNGVRYYEMRVTEGSGFDDDDAWTRIPGSDGDTTSHVVTGLTNGTAYRIELRTIIHFGASGTVGVTATPQDRAPSFGDATVADATFTQDVAITAFTLPEATGGDGTLSYALTPTLPAGLALDMATREVSGTPTAALAATSYSWTATDEDGDTASLGFSIEVLAGAGTNAAQRQAFAKSLAGLAARTLGGARETIGQRLDAAPGASSLTVAGRRVEFGAPDDRRRRAETPDDVRIDWETLRRDSAFEMAFGEAGSGLEMTAWGRGGLMRFEAEQAGIDHRSRMETGWLGMDARVGDGLLMGFALSRSAGETEASDGAGFTTALSAAWPYAQLKLASGAEVWTVLGAGNGSVDYRPAEGAGEREALEMRLASAGGRQPLADLGALGLALEADAGFVTLETGGSARSVIGGHEVQVWRARASLEAEHEGWGLGGGALSPFGSLAWRGDGGDWREGSGVEAGFGARLSAPGSRFALEAEGRHLALSSEAGYGGTGASLTAGLEPASDGAGLSWSMSLATGVRADGAAMLADDLDYDEAGFGADEDRMALELEARYGFRLPAAHGLLSPLLRLSEEEGVRRKLEAGLAFQAAKGRVDLELTGGHEARNGAADDHRLHLDLRLGF